MSKKEMSRIFLYLTRLKAMAGAMRPTSPKKRIGDRRVSITYGKEEKQFGFAGSDTKADRDLIIREAFSIPLDSSFRLRGEDGAYRSSSA